MASQKPRTLFPSLLVGLLSQISTTRYVFILSIIKPKLQQTFLSDYVRMEEGEPTINKKRLVWVEVSQLHRKHPFFFNILLYSRQLFIITQYSKLYEVFVYHNILKKKTLTCLQLSNFLYYKLLIIKIDNCARIKEMRILLKNGITCIIFQKSGLDPKYCK